MSENQAYNWREMDRACFGQVTLKEKSSIVKVVVSSVHTLVLFANGKVAAFGENNSGQLGIGTNENAFSPNLVQLNEVATDIACGKCHSVF
eukprot:UN00162